MAKIEFSPVFAAGLPQRLINLNNNTISGTNPSGVGLLNAPSYDNGNFLYKIYLYLFQGTKLTSSQMVSSRNLSTAGTPFKSSILNDTLVKFANNTDISSNSGNFRNSVVNGDIITINTGFVSATTSGAATWFCLYHDINNTIGNFITGDVGITGSGADIEIPDTNLTSGELYRILGWKLKFPSSWEY